MVVTPEAGDVAGESAGEAAVQPDRTRWSAVWLVMGALALLHVLMGWRGPFGGYWPEPGAATPLRPQLTALVRVALTVDFALVVLYFPGLALRTGLRRRHPQAYWVSLVPLPGLAYLAGVGALTWKLAPEVDAGLVAGIATVPLVVVCSLVLAKSTQPVIARDERTVLACVLFLLLTALGRATYSRGPALELFGGTVARTFETGWFSDSATSYHVVKLASNGIVPTEGVGGGAVFFHPYQFFDRGPLPGLAADPVVETAGSEVAADPALPFALDNQPWTPFDRQGFQAYRIFMMTLAVSVLLPLFGLLRTLSSTFRANIGVVLAAGAPFVLHETYFTWPKLVAVGMVLAAAQFLVLRRPVITGALVGVALVCHPSTVYALAPLLLLLVLLAVGDRREGGLVRRALVAVPRAAVDGIKLAIGLAPLLLGWMLLGRNRSNQASFVAYLFQADNTSDPTFALWVGSRIEDVLNTLVPFHLLLRHDPGDWLINSPYGTATLAERAGYLWWTTLPLGLGLVMAAVLAVGLVRGSVRHPWVAAAVIAVPFVVATVHWGFSDIGLLLTGSLHAWFFALIIFVVWAAPSFTAARLRWYRWAAVLRVPDVALMLLLGTAATRGLLDRDAFALTDVLALAMMGIGVVGVAVVSWITLSLPESPASPASPGSPASTVPEPLAASREPAPAI